MPSARRNTGIGVMSDYSSVLGVIHDHDPMKACSSLFFWGGGGIRRLGPCSEKGER